MVYPTDVHVYFWDLVHFPLCTCVYVCADGRFKLFQHYCKIVNISILFVLTYKLFAINTYLHFFRYIRSNNVRYIIYLKECYKFSCICIHKTTETYIIWNVVLEFVKSTRRSEISKTFSLSSVTYKSKEYCAFSMYLNAHNVI